MRASSGGYTIVEVMIVLAVTGMLFVMAWNLIGGRQKRVQFNEGIRETLTKVQSVISEVNNGYFKNASNLQCYVTNSSNWGTYYPGSDPVPKFPRPYVTTGGDKSAGNYQPECIFFGKAIQFGTDTDKNQLVTHTILANATTQVSAQTVRVDSLRVDYLNSRIILPTGIEDFRETSALPWGIDVKKVVSGASSNLNTVVFIGGFSGAYQQTDTSEQKLEGGALNVTPVVLATNFTTADDAENRYIGDPWQYLNTARTEIKDFIKTTVCLTDGGQEAALVFDKGASGQLTVEMTYDVAECA